jgi:hypothetical protein
MDRVKWAFLWISLGIIWMLKIMELLPGQWFDIFYRLKYFFPALVILLGLYLFLRRKYPGFASWVFWLTLFLMGLWLISTTYSEKTWI